MVFSNGVKGDIELQAQVGLIVDMRRKIMTIIGLAKILPVVMSLDSQN